MTTLSQRIRYLSIAVLALAGIITATVTSAAAPASSRYYGRWSVSEDRPVFTARGRLYKTIDIAPCGNDFCGVSVNDKGQCGPVLFRFLGKRAHDDSGDYLRGHGKWGDARKNVVIYSFDEDGPPPNRTLELYLGEGYDFGERSDNMPKFHANYHRTRMAVCKAR